MWNTRVLARSDSTCLKKACIQELNSKCWISLRRNTADTLIHGCKKTLEESKDKVSEDEKSAIEAAISDLEEALKGDDKDSIEEKTKALTDASSSMAQRLYAEQQQESQGADQANDSDNQGSNEENVVDADFEEVKEESR